MDSEEKAVEKLRRAAREHYLAIDLDDANRIDASMYKSQTKLVLKRAINNLKKVWDDNGQR